MKLSELMTRDVAICRLDSTLESAANLFWSGDVGVLPVVDVEGRVAGMLTDRDVCLSGFFRGRLLGEIAVSEAMSTSVTSCLTTESLEDALAKMTDAKVRRLPIVDAEGLLKGMVGLMDVVRALTESKLTLKGAKGLLDTLCAIGLPHGASAKTDKPVELKPVSKSKTVTPVAAKSTAKRVDTVAAAATTKVPAKAKAPATVPTLSSTKASTKDPAKVAAKPAKKKVAAPAKATKSSARSKPGKSPRKA